MYIVQCCNMGRKLNNLKNEDITSTFVGKHLFVFPVVISRRLVFLIPKDFQLNSN